MGVKSKGREISFTRSGIRIMAAEGTEFFSWAGYLDKLRFLNIWLAIRLYKKIYLCKFRKHRSLEKYSTFAQKFPKIFLQAETNVLQFVVVV